MLKQLIFIIILINISFSKEQFNDKSIDLPEAVIRDLDKPFRMAKLNVLWSKAKLRLTEPKLKSLFSELKIHDKEEITWKRLKAEGKDKDGMKEGQLRKKLVGIMSSYDLLEHFEDVHDKDQQMHHRAFNEANEEYVNKKMFKDKKLNKLWMQAEYSGFTPDELKTLKEEFYHHENKIDEYYGLLNNLDERKQQDSHLNTIDETIDIFNEIDTKEETNEIPNKDYSSKVNLLRQKHFELREGYEELKHKSSKGPRSTEFVEPSVQRLWKLALEGNFSTEELASLKVELLHYENRLQKLKRLQVELALDAENAKKSGKVQTKNDELLMPEDVIKKHSRKTQIHYDMLEDKILRNHIEL